MLEYFCSYREIPFTSYIVHYQSLVHFIHLLMFKILSVPLSNIDFQLSRLITQQRCFFAIGSAHGGASQHPSSFGVHYMLVLMSSCPGLWNITSNHFIGESNVVKHTVQPIGKHHLRYLLHCLCVCYYIEVLMPNSMVRWNMRCRTEVKGKQGIRNRRLIYLSVRRLCLLSSQANV